MKIFNTKIYGLEESFIASGLPMLKNIENIDYSNTNFNNSYKRATILGNSKQSSGHDCFLKGIVVQADIQAPQYFWQQWQRYHFQDIISSQSKMHKIHEINLKDSCSEYVLPEILEILNKLQRKYNNDKTSNNFLVLLNNLPMGMMLTARITTNYLQLKTIYQQRKNHKLPEWNTHYKEWLYSLAFFKELCTQIK